MALSTATTKSSTAPAAFQQPYIQEVFKQAQQLYNQPGPTFYPGSTVAPFTPTEQAGQTALAQYAQQGLPDLLKQYNAAFSWGLNAPQNINDNPYLSQAIQSAIRPVWQGLTEQALPAIRAGVGRSGTTGSSRQALAEAQAIDRATQTAGDISSRMSLGAYNQGMQTMLGTMGLAPQTAQLGELPGQILSGIGAQERSLDQAKIQENVARHMYEQNLPYNKLTEYANMVRGPFGSEAQGTIQYPEVGMPEQIASAGSALLPLLRQIYDIFT